MPDDDVNALGDQDADNSQQGYQYPASAYEPTPQNVRRYPELHPDAQSSDDELDETLVDDDNADDDDDDDDSSTRVTV